MNQFSERMSTLSNENLLKILDERMDYQPEAVQATENELKNRNLSGSETKEIKDKKESERKINKKVLIRLKATRENIKKITAEIPDTYNPLSKETFRKNIAAVSIFIIIYGLFFLNGIRYISVGPLIVLTLLVVSGIQLWRKKKSGWIILTGLLTCNSLFYLSFMTIEIVRRIKIKPFVQYDDIKFILELIGIISFWLYINNKYFREYLKINKKTRIITYIISGLFVALAIGLSREK